MEQGDLLLDFISTRATVSPADLALALDLPRSRAITYSGPPITDDRPSTNVLLTPSVYGTTVNYAQSDNDRAAIDQSIKDDEACSIYDALPMVERQREYYTVALAITKDLDRDAKSVDLELVQSYSDSIRNKAYAGRGVVCNVLRIISYAADDDTTQYSPLRLSQIVVTDRAYAEDHLDFLREDHDCEHPHAPVNRTVHTLTISCRCHYGYQRPHSHAGRDRHTL